MLNRLVDRRLLAVLMVSGAMVGLARAQDSESHAPVVESPRAGKQLRPANSSTAAGDSPGPMITVEFAGGTARQFVDAVRKAAGEARVNVIMPKEAESVTLPAISLNNVGVFTALQALEYAAGTQSGNEFGVNTIGSSTEPSRTFAIKYASHYPAPGMMQAQMQGTPPPRQETRVFSIRELVEAPAGLEANPDASASTETVLNALRTATQLDVDAKQPAPELMLHKESMLLLIRATQEQQRTIESVLQQLRYSVDSRRGKAIEELRRQKAIVLEQAEMRAQQDQNEIQMAKSRDRLAVSMDRMARMRDMAAAGKASADEVANAQAEMDNARDIMIKTEATKRDLDERKAVIEARVQTGGEFGSGSGESPVAVAYNYTDLKAFYADVFAICRAMLPPERDAHGDVFKGSSDGNLVFRGTPREHRVLVAALNAMRRAKANEPALPGQDATELIRKNEVK